MTDRPIIFSALMVLALLREAREPGTGKTETRQLAWQKSKWGMVPPTKPQTYLAAPSPWQKVAVGDRLYVREPWSVVRHEPCLEHERDWQDLSGPIVRYLADGATRHFQGDRKTGKGIYHGPVEKGRPSIHMPRWASRLTLTVTAVHAEPLHAITKAGAIAEGCREFRCKGPYRGPAATYWTMTTSDSPLSISRTNPVSAFKAFWETLHGEESWFDNPTVMVIAFRPELRNIDAEGNDCRRRPSRRPTTTIRWPIIWRRAKSAMRQSASASWPHARRRNRLRYPNRRPL